MSVSRKRPKGYATWRPRLQTGDVLSQVFEVLSEFQAYLPLTARRDLARWFHDSYVYDGKIPVMLHLGDYDPDGESIFESLVEDVWAFLMRDAPGLIFRHERDDLFVRVALTEAHIDMFGLPTAPPKKTSSRTKNWTGAGTCQLEALPPDELRAIVIRNVFEYIDPEVLSMDRKAEVTARRNIAGALPAAREAS